MNTTQNAINGKIEACKTYIEQTKLLVTLASAFLLAPLGLVSILKDKTTIGLNSSHLNLFIFSESLFVTSVLFGYVVLGSITGSQDDGSFNVYRNLTRIFSLLQFLSYIAGLILFIRLVYLLI